MAPGDSSLQDLPLAPTSLRSGQDLTRALPYPGTSVAVVHGQTAQARIGHGPLPAGGHEFTVRPTCPSQSLTVRKPAEGSSSLLIKSTRPERGRGIQLSGTALTGIRLGGGYAAPRASR